MTVKEFAEKNGMRILETKRLNIADVMEVMTTEPQIYGAVNMLRKEELQKTAEKFDGDIFLIPSSIHEVIAVKAVPGEGAIHKEILLDGNNTAIGPDEFLSENIYLYCKDTGELSYADIG